MRRYGFQSIDDLYASVGYGGLTAQKVVFRLRDEWTKLNKTLEAKKNLEAVYNEESKTVQAEPAKRHASSKGIVVKDIDNCLVRLARCCNPVAGDDIVGFITKGRGVSVHRRDCPNMNPQSMSEEDKGRFIAYGGTMNAVRHTLPTCRWKHLTAMVFCLKLQTFFRHLKYLLNR